MRNIDAILGIASAIFTIGGYIPYIYSILRRKTKPERASWWIWSILMAVTVVVQVEQGVTWPLLLTVAYLIGNISVALLSVKYGYGKFGTKDKASLIFAILGVAIWIFTKNPTLALLMIISIDLLGNLLTLQKSWKVPKSESLIAWSLLGLGAILGLASVGNLGTVKAIFPAYEAIINSIIPIAIFVRRS